MQAASVATATTNGLLKFRRYTVDVRLRTKIAPFVVYFSILHCWPRLFSPSHFDVHDGKDYRLVVCRHVMLLVVRLCHLRERGGDDPVMPAGEVARRSGYASTAVRRTQRAGVGVMGGERRATADRGEKMLTVALTPVCRPRTCSVFLTCLTWGYHHRTNISCPDPVGQACDRASHTAPWCGDSQPAHTTTRQRALRGTAAQHLQTAQLYDGLAAVKSRTRWYGRDFASATREKLAFVSVRPVPSRPAARHASSHWRPPASSREI